MPSVLVVEAASTTVEAIVKTSIASAVAVVGGLVESVVGAVAIAVPEALHVVEGVCTAESSATLVEARHAAVESIAIATCYVAKSGAETNTTIDALLLLLRSGGCRFCFRLLFGDRLVFSMCQSGNSRKDG